METVEAEPFDFAREDMLRSIEKGLQDSVGALACIELEPDRQSVSGPDRAMVVTAMVGFKGLFHGLVSLHCPEALALRIAGGMLGIDPSGIDDDVRDAMGEVVNIVGGEVKRLLSPGGLEVALSPPSVYHGDDDRCDGTPDGQEGLLCAYLHEGERLLVRVAVSKAE